MGTLATLTVGLILTSEAFHKGLEAAESKAASSSHSISGALASIGTGIAVAGVAVATAGVVALTKFLGIRSPRPKRLRPARRSWRRCSNPPAGPPG